MSTSFERDAADVLRQAVGIGIVSPRPDAIQKLVDCNDSVLKSLMESVSEQTAQTMDRSPWIGSQSSWQLPSTRRFKTSKQPPQTPTIQPVAGQNWIVELGRFSVPFNSVGIIKSFEQYMTDGTTIFTAQSEWGNPFPSRAVKWFFRLSPLSKVGSDWISMSGSSAIPDYLPGNAYDDFSQTPNLWFPASSPASANIHLPIPGGHVLRLFAIVSSGVEPVSISGKLTGTTQSEMNEHAQTVVKTTW